MQILFVIQASHWNVGGHALVRRYAAFAHNAGFKTSVMVVPYFDRLGDSSYHWFTNAKIAKKTYDHCFVFESAPPEEWLEAFDTIYWVPMVEFTKKSHIENLHPSIKILWHARSGFYAASDIIKDDSQQTYMPYIIDAFEWKGNIDQNLNKIIVHQRARCLDVDTFMETLLTKSAKAEVILWNHVGKRDALNHWEGPRVKLIKGWLEEKKWKEMTDQSSFYVAGRAMEGIGLCVQEAAASNCIIAGPNQSVSAEYVDGQDASILVDLYERPQEDWLTKRYAWSSVDGVNEEATVELAERVAKKIDFSDSKAIIKGKESARKQIVDSCESFQEGMQRIFRSMKKREIFSIPKTRRRILSIQTATWGGQGLFELWMNRLLSRYPHHSIFSSRLWIQKNDAEEQTEYARLMSEHDVRMVAPHYEDLMSVDPDFVIYHWSGGCERFANEDQLNSVESFLFNTKATIIVFVHNIRPMSLPDWLKNAANVFVFPAEHAANAYRPYLDKVAITVLPHFLDPELASIPVEPKRNKILIGALGRIQWSKFDPIYYQAISEFLKESPGREFMWIGCSADGYLEGDEFTSSTICPDIKAVFGPDRAAFLDKITVGLFLSPIEESFCLAALEMASRGVPIITNRSEIKNLLGEAAVMAASPESVLQSLRLLVRDGKAYGKMMRAGRKLHEAKEYSFKTWETNFFSLLSRVSADHGFGQWTVIIPCHNVEHYLEKCIDSVMTNNPHQVIMVLDGCTDDTYVVAKKMKKKYDRDHHDISILINNEPPHSQCRSWKMAIPHVKNNLIALVDGDDMISDKALIKMGKAHIEDPKACLIWSNQCVIDNSGKPVNVSFSSLPKNGETILKAMENGDNIVSHLITFKAWGIPFLEFPDDLEASADKHLALQLEERAPWKFVNDELYIYRWMRPGSITLERNDIQEQSKIRVLEMARERRKRT